MHVAFLLIKAATEVTSLSLSQLYFMNFSILCISTVKILIALNYAYLINTPSVYGLRTFKPVGFELFSGVLVFFVIRLFARGMQINRMGRTNGN